MTVGVTHGAPHHLVADSALTLGGVFTVRPTRAGDLWEAAHLEKPRGTLLGMPGRKPGPTK